MFVFVFVCARSRNISNTAANTEKVIKQFGRLGLYDSGCFCFCANELIVLMKNGNEIIEIFSTSVPLSSIHILPIILGPLLTFPPPFGGRLFTHAHKYPHSIQIIAFALFPPTNHIQYIQPYSIAIAIAIELRFVRRNKITTKLYWTKSDLDDSVKCRRAAEHNQSIDGKEARGNGHRPRR